ncbi:Uncharacterised protein [Clostridioides difficile]|uniref:Uncharacterized protein n=1 Tax=Clostridioides difficile TaxID=1496 RepID=A0AAX3GYM5_CLODI|nr:hypothetical protein CDIF29020_03443 [Clostridioides difficile]SHO39147.1 hypothetical protein CDIFFM120_03360C [Clostridioides difficile M120]AXU91820.1 hypothetical protein CDIF29747_03357 [Clostridioides difficile]OMK38957.1 hypothetical protein BER34_000500 [Clostridioides difficile]OMK66432.1 hypothetical protein BER35_003316 [Clostridioides difficile]
MKTNCKNLNFEYRMKIDKYILMGGYYDSKV